jgi:hypothetical protein
MILDILRNGGGLCPTTRILRIHFGQQAEFLGAVWVTLSGERGEMKKFGRYEYRKLEPAEIYEGHSMELEGGQVKILAFAEIVVIVKLDAGQSMREIRESLEIKPPDNPDAKKTTDATAEAPAPVASSTDAPLDGWG